MPTYLERVRGLELARADLLVGGVTAIAGLFGTFLGGYLGDWLARRVRQGHLWLSGMATVAAIGPAWVTRFHRRSSERSPTRAASKGR